MKRIITWLGDARVLAAAAILALSTAGADAASYKSIIVNKTDGNTVSLNISDDLATTFDNGTLSFSTPDETTAVSMDEVDGWNFSENKVTSLVSDFIATGNVTITATAVVFDGLDTATRISVVALDGRTVASATADGHYELPLTGLGSGVYVITYNNQSLKIAVR